MKSLLAALLFSSFAFAQTQTASARLLVAVMTMPDSMLRRIRRSISSLNRSWAKRSYTSFRTTAISMHGHAQPHVLASTAHGLAQKPKAILTSSPLAIPESIISAPVGKVSPETDASQPRFTFRLKPDILIFSGRRISSSSTGLRQSNSGTDRDEPQLLISKFALSTSRAKK